MWRYLAIPLLVLVWSQPALSAPKNLWADYYRSKFETELAASGDAATLARKYRELFGNDKVAFKDFYTRVFSRLDHGGLRAEILEFACSNDKPNCLHYVHEAAKLAADRDRLDKLLTELYLDNYPRDKERYQAAFPDLYAALKEPSRRNEALETSCRTDKSNCGSYLQTAIQQKVAGDDNDKLLLTLFGNLLATNRDAGRLLFSSAFVAIKHYDIRTQLLVSSCNRDPDQIAHYFDTALADKNFIVNQFSDVYDLYKSFVKRNNHYFNQTFATFYRLTPKSDLREKLLEFSCSSDHGNCANYLRAALDQRTPNLDNEKFLLEIYQKVLAINPDAYKELFESVFSRLDNEKVKTELLNFSCNRDARNCSHYLASALNDTDYAERQGANILEQFKKTIKNDPAYYKDNYLALYRGTKNVDYKNDLLEYSCNNDSLNCWFYFNIALTSLSGKSSDEKKLLPIYQKFLRSNPGVYKDKFAEVFSTLKIRDIKQDLLEFSCESDHKNATYYFSTAIKDEDFSKSSNDLIIKLFKSLVRSDMEYYRTNFLAMYNSIMDDDDRLDFAEYSCNADRKQCNTYYIDAIDNEVVAKNSLAYFSYLVRNSNNAVVLSSAKTIFGKCRAIDSKALYDFYEKVVVLSGPTDETAIAIVTKGVGRDDDIALKFLDVVKKYPEIYAGNEAVYASIANLIVKTGNAKLKQAALAVHEQRRMARQPVAAAPASLPVKGSSTPPPPPTASDPAKIDFKIVKTGVVNRNGVAVIIGNRNYASKGKNIPNVDYAHNDAELMKRYVIDTLGYDPANIIFVKDATQADMISIFGSPSDHRGKLNNWVKRGVSDVVVFYSGHGAPSLKNGKGYILPVDADPMTIELNGYKLDLFYENLAKVEARNKTVIIDACFSGASQNGSVITNASSIALREKADPATLVDDTTVFTASGPDEIASWDTQLRTGLLTGHFLRGLSGEADATEFGNGDGQITAGEMRRYLESEVSYAARRNYGRDQHPQVFSKDETVLLRYR